MNYFQNGLPELILNLLMLIITQKESLNIN
jgi:hypothetical protein